MPERTSPTAPTTNTTTSMTPTDARRIQSSADRTGTNQGFKSRAQSAAARSAQPSRGAGGRGGGGGRRR